MSVTSGLICRRRNGPMGFLQNRGLWATKVADNLSVFSNNNQLRCKTITSAMFQLKPIYMAYSFAMLVLRKMISTQ